MHDLFSPDRCYRPDEIATALNVNISTVYRMIKNLEDPLPSFRINNKVLRVSGKDIRTYLESHQVIPENE